jgi:hypothetical protein
MQTRERDLNINSLFTRLDVNGAAYSAREHEALGLLAPLLPFKGGLGATAVGTVGVVRDEQLTLPIIDVAAVVADIVLLHTITSTRKMNRMIIEITKTIIPSQNMILQMVNIHIGIDSG